MIMGRVSTSSFPSISTSRLWRTSHQEGGHTEEETMTADIREEFEQLREEMGEFCGAKKSELERGLTKIW